MFRVRVFGIARCFGTALCRLAGFRARAFVVARRASGRLGVGLRTLGFRRLCLSHADLFCDVVSDCGV